METLLANDMFTGILTGGTLVGIITAIGVLITKIWIQKQKDTKNTSDIMLSEREALAQERSTQYSQLLTRLNQVESKQSDTEKALLKCAESEGHSKASLTISAERIAELSKQVQELTLIVGNVTGKQSK